MRILVISDIHANFAALEAVLQDAGGFDRVWCLGDVVGYGPEPNECINRLRELDLVCLAGNHDLAVAGKVALWDFTRDAREVIFWTRHWLTTANHEWLQALPAEALVRDGITLVHASPRDPVWEYIVTPDVVKSNLELVSTSVCLHGHTHLPLIFRKPWDDWRIVEEWSRNDSPIRLVPYNQMFINPGSVGQPRDEDPRAAYAILDLDAMTFTHRRVKYAVSATQQLMKRAKFPNGLIRRLRFGQ